MGKKAFSQQEIWPEKGAALGRAQQQNPDENIRLPVCVEWWQQDLR